MVDVREDMRRGDAVRDVCVCVIVMRIGDRSVQVVLARCAADLLFRA